MRRKWEANETEQWKTSVVIEKSNKIHTTHIHKLITYESWNSRNIINHERQLDSFSALTMSNFRSVVYFSPQWKCHIFSSSSAHSFANTLWHVAVSASCINHVKNEYFQMSMAKYAKTENWFENRHKLPWPSQFTVYGHIYSLRLNERQNLYYIETRSLWHALYWLACCVVFLKPYKIHNACRGRILFFSLSMYTARLIIIYRMDERVFTRDNTTHEIVNRMNGQNERRTNQWINRSQ